MRRIAPPFRFWIAVSIFCTTFTTYMMRSNMSVSIIAMVEDKNQNSPCNNATKKTEIDNENKYKWSQIEQGLVLAAYSFGDLGMWPFGKMITQKFGPRNVIVLSSIFSATLTALTPLSARGGAIVVVSCRLFIGLFGSFIYPALIILINNWTPPLEQDMFYAVMMGTIFGTAFTWPLVGVVSEMITWQWAFYMISIITSAHILLFAVLVSDSPHAHRWITNEEKKYIVESQGVQIADEKLPVPFREIMCSVPVWAFVIAHFGDVWGLSLIFTYAPMYFCAFGFSLVAASCLAAIPYVAKLFCSHMVLVFVSHYCEEASKLRKHFVVFSHIVPAGFLFLMQLAGCYSELAILLVVLSQAFNGAAVTGHLINPYDLSPNFTGVLYGFASLLSGIARIAVPIFTGSVNEYVRVNNSLPADLIFMTGSAMFGFSGIVFIIFGTGQVQSWNDNKKLVEPSES